MQWYLIWLFICLHICPKMTYLPRSRLIFFQTSSYLTVQRLNYPSIPSHLPHHHLATLKSRTIRGLPYSSRRNPPVISPLLVHVLLLDVLLLYSLIHMTKNTVSIVIAGQPVLLLHWNQNLNLKILMRSFPLNYSILRFCLSYTISKVKLSL